MINAVAGTDVSILPTGSHQQHSVRINAFSDPIEINASETVILGLLRKLKLADVVTTTSANLPPYLLINNLGADLDFSIYYEDKLAISESLKQGEWLCDYVIM